ncbi:MAG: Thiamin-phosphate pyrophosphorylase (EC [uncultured Sulfurovum sp.]|uniref:Thiamine-phosphate synthase n=1 Tax=uncultured Sulfurovum sp. TaxID=269237 RepID=A0A6S6T6Q3_9BACT|nr:MAG: Thiamin-phosphate pyrophosphorylase (EC [uncultured Sulfurovum sp.]
MISDDTLTPKSSILTQVQQALEGGAKIVQLRNKTDNDDEIRNLSQQLQVLCMTYDALFVLNDKIDIAIELGVDGLHIGKSDHHRFKEIRENFKGVIGVSCYGDLSLAKEMQNMGADYVAFGSFYASPTKPNANIVPLAILSEAKAKLTIPVCAIGGISLENIHEVMEEQPDMVSLVSDIWNAREISEQSKHYSKLF